MAWQDPKPIYVTVPPDSPQVETPATTVGDLVVGSLGVAGVMLLVSILLGGLVAVLLVRWHRRHPPEERHLPPVTPFAPPSDNVPSSRVR